MCCCFFIVFWVIMLAIGVLGLILGNPFRLGESFG